MKIIEAFKKINTPLTRNALFALTIFFALFAYSGASDAKLTQAITKSIIDTRFKEILVETIRSETEPLKLSIDEMADDVASMKVEVAKINSRYYSEIVRQLEKTHEKLQKGDTSDITNTNLKAFIDSWKELPVEMQSGSLKVKYDALVRLYTTRMEDN
jgi:hypothetical protein